MTKTAKGITTFYLVDTNNLTGYAQVVEELRSNIGVIKSYTYGLDLISQKQGSIVSFYNYDGHGSVRKLTSDVGNATDSYDYDAFGNLIAQTGNTSNSYLYAGEQFDADLGFYYNRARYLNVETGRFVSMDSYEGNSSDPLSLHKYLYGNGNPVDNIDPTGNFSLNELKVTLVNIGVLATNLAARFLPPAVLLGHRIANWIYANQIKIDFYWTLFSIGAQVYIDESERLLLNNEEEVELENGNPGNWVERKVRANSTDYEIIDDFRDGNVTSIKTNQQTMERLLGAIDKEAKTLGNRNSDFQPIKNAPSTVRPIPISSVKTRTLLMVIPENHFTFLSNPTFLRTIRQIQQTTRTAISVVPLKGWKK